MKTALRMCVWAWSEFDLNGIKDGSRLISTSKRAESARATTRDTTTTFFILYILYIYLISYLISHTMFSECAIECNSESSCFSPYQYYNSLSNSQFSSSETSTTRSLWTLRKTKTLMYYDNCRLTCLVSAGGDWGVFSWFTVQYSALSTNSDTRDFKKYH